MGIKNIEFAGPENRNQSRIIADLFSNRTANADQIRGITAGQELRLLDSAMVWHQYLNDDDETRGDFLRNRITQLVA